MEGALFFSCVETPTSAKEGGLEIIKNKQSRALVVNRHSLFSLRRLRSRSSLYTRKGFFFSFSSLILFSFDFFCALDDSLVGGVATALFCPCIYTVCCARNPSKGNKLHYRQRAPREWWKVNKRLSKEWRKGNSTKTTVAYLGLSGVLRDLLRFLNPFFFSSR